MTIYSLDKLFSYLELVCCSMSRSNCCFLTCIQVSQEAVQVVLYSHLFQNFPQFIVIQSCPILSDPIDCSPSGFSVYGILQASILAAGCHFLLQQIFPTQGLNPGPLHFRQILYHLSHQGSHTHTLGYSIYPQLYVPKESSSWPRWKPG